MNEWYRKQTWTEEDEKDFFAHLARSRTEWNRAQYLFLQAVTLYDTRNEAFFDVVLSLLDRYFNDFPHEQGLRASCLHLYGRVLYDRREYDAALECYREGAYQERKEGSIVSGAWLDYARLTVQLGRTEQYEEAAGIVLREYASLIFPIQQYRANAVLAIISDYFGDAEQARSYKALAQEAALAEKNALRHNSDIGLVEERDDFLEMGMEKIAL